MCGAMGVVDCNRDAIFRDAIFALHGDMRSVCKNRLW